MSMSMNIAGTAAACHGFVPLAPLKLQPNSLSLGDQQEDQLGCWGRNDRLRRSTATAKLPNLGFEPRLSIILSYVALKIWLSMLGSVARHVVQGSQAGAADAA